MSVIIACRGCRIPIQGDGGCDLCRDFRKNLVLLGDLPSDEVDLGDLSTETLAILRRVLKQYKTKLENLPQGDIPPREITQTINQVSKAIATVVAETRKIREQGVESLKGMSFPERLDLFVAWFSELAPRHRDKVMEDLKKEADRLTRPVLSIVGD